MHHRTNVFSQPGLGTVFAGLCVTLVGALAVVASCDGSGSGHAPAGGGGGGAGGASEVESTGTAGFSGTGGDLGDAGLGTGGAFGNDGSSGSGGVSGSFVWSTGSQSFSNSGYYYEGTTTAGTSFTILISSDYSQLEIPCWVEGQFPAVPPPPGTYPIVDGSTPTGDGTFVGGCSTVVREATVYADPGVSGMVTLTASAPGMVQGSFTMRSRPNGSFAGTGGAPGPMIDYAGSFTVGCLSYQTISDPSCAARSVSSP